MKRVISHFKLHNKYIIVGFLCVLLGGLTTVSFDALRYTKYVEPNMVEMDPQVAYKAIQENPDGYLFFDVRTQGEYDKLHASSSESVPIQKLYDRWSTLPRSGKKIYLICTTGKLAAVAYGYLQLHGFTNIVHITGGIQNWALEGMPVISGPVFTDTMYPLDKPVDISSVKLIK